MALNQNVYDNSKDASGGKAGPPEKLQAAGNLIPGQRNVSFGKYLWRVLDVQDGKALLLSEEILEQRKYHNKFTVTWETCKLRAYLNGEFLQKFSSEEQSRIAQTVTANPGNPWSDVPGERSTTDKVFLLSIEEVKNYFGDNKERIAYYGNDTAWWWLRSPGFWGGSAAGVRDDGSLSLDGLTVHFVHGVRPALWINL